MTASATHSQSLLDLLEWNEEKGIGYFPVDQYLEGQNPYDEAYWQKYLTYATTELGERLTSTRLNFVDQFTNGLVVDIGIGSGQFITERAAPTLGFDINESAIAWLVERGVFQNPYGELNETIEAMTFWDSLEHIKDPAPLLRKIKVGGYVFVAIPIYTGRPHVLRSKHFRPDEHYHYHTHEGLVGFLWDLGFRPLEFHDKEIPLGREDIYTFAFRRFGKGKRTP